ncbi:MAG: hypothetical protein AAF961_11625, partial [Planctomycetota bacterium]
LETLTAWRNIVQKNAFTRSTVVLLLLCVATACKTDHAAGAEIAELLHRLPDDANALIVLNAEAMYESPLGKRENWRQKYAAAHEATPLLLPPSAKYCALAAEFDIASMQPQWEAAVMELSTNPNGKELEAKLGGVLDTIEGFEAVWTPTKACVLKFAPHIFGVISPVNRQTVARWAQDVASDEPAELSPYLRSAAQFTESIGTEIILAIDLQHALRRQDVAAAVKQSELLKDIPQDQAVNVLSSILGVKLGVRVGERLSGRLNIDFQEDASVLRPVAKDLIISIISGAGAMLDDFRDWKAEVRGGSLSIHGELSNDGLRRILSLLSLDASVVDSPPSGPTISPPSAASPAKQNEDREARASLRYFRGISKYVDDLDRLRRAHSLDQAIFWIENYARKVDRLPTANVDPELLDYGYSVGARFRQIVDSATGAIDRADQMASQSPGGNVTVGAIPTFRRINFGGYIYREYAPYAKAQIDVGAMQRQQEASDQELQQGLDQAISIMQSIVSDTAQMRETMTQRYGLKF